MSDSDSSGLSSAPSDAELDNQASKDGILKFFKPAKKKSIAAAPTRKSSTPPRKREPSPAHEYVLADQPEFAVRLRPSIATSEPRSSRDTLVEENNANPTCSFWSCIARDSRMPFPSPRLILAR